MHDSTNNLTDYHVVCDINVFIDEIQDVICETHDDEIKVVKDSFDGLNNRLKTVHFELIDDKISCSIQSQKDFLEMTVLNPLDKQLSDFVITRDAYFLSLFVQNCYPDFHYDSNNIKKRVDNIIVKYYLDGQLFSNIEPKKQQQLITTLGYLTTRFTLASLENQPISVYTIFDEITKIYPLTFDLEAEIEDFASLSHNKYLSLIVSESLMSWYKQLKFNN